jgi:predicted transcriptional regulator
MTDKENDTMLKPGERWLLHCLRDQPSSIDALCSITGFCRSTVCKMLKKLEGQGVLTIKRTLGQPNHYTINTRE